MSNKRLIDGMSDTYKAFIVQDEPGTNHVNIVFATSRGNAIYKSDAYSEYGYPFIYIRALRRPQYDIYAPAGYVPKEELLKDGWWFECHGRKESGHRCLNVLTEDNKPLVVDEQVYCNHSCYERGLPGITDGGETD